MNHKTVNNPNEIISLNKSLNFAISVLATLKCGACYLPILVDTPTDRISYILSKSKSSYFICSKDNTFSSEGIFTVNISTINYNNHIY